MQLDTFHAVAYDAAFWIAVTSVGQLLVGYLVYAGGKHSVRKGDSARGGKDLLTGAGMSGLAILTLLLAGGVALTGLAADFFLGL